jgi:hypothetical protein
MLSVVQLSVIAPVFYDKKLIAEEEFEEDFSFVNTDPYEAVPFNQSYLLSAGNPYWKGRISTMDLLEKLV